MDLTRHERTGIVLYGAVDHAPNIYCAVEAVRRLTDVGRESLRLLSRKEAAKLLSLSEKTLDRRIASGDLEAVRDGGRVLIAPEAIADYKAKLRARAARPDAA